MNASLPRLPILAIVLGAVALALPQSASGYSFGVTQTGLRPVGDSPISGLATARERAGRLRVHAVTTDARQVAQDEFDSLIFSFARVRCGETADRTFEVAGERLDGRGLEYTALTKDLPGTLAARARSLTVSLDLDRDGTLEPAACGRVRSDRIARRVQYSIDLDEAGGSGIGGLALARERGSNLRIRAVLAEQRASDAPALDLNLLGLFTTRRCGRGAGDVLQELEIDDYDVTLNASTSAERPRDEILRHAKSLRIVGDWNGDGKDDIAACGRGLVVTTSPINAARSVRSAREGRLRGTFRFGVLDPVGGSPISGLVFARERPNRLRAQWVFADGGQPLVNFENIEFKYSRAACGQPAGRTLDFDGEHVEGRGLEYTGTTTVSQGTLAVTVGADSLRVNVDRDANGVSEEVACGRIRHAPRGGAIVSVVDLSETGGSGIEGLVFASEEANRIDLQSVLVDSLNNKHPELERLRFDASRCGEPAGSSPYLIDPDRMEGIVSRRTGVSRRRNFVLRRAESLRIVGDWNGDGRDDLAACGLLGGTYQPDRG